MRSHIGSRRSFICRVRLGQIYQQQQQSQHHMQIIDPNSMGFWAGNSRVTRNRNTLKTSIDEPNKPSYAVVHVTGYTKIWPPVSSSNGQMMEHMYHLDEQARANSPASFLLIAIARIQMSSAPNDFANSSNAEFVTRHDQNGNITFVDQK